MKSWLAISAFAFAFFLVSGEAPARAQNLATAGEPDFPQSQNGSTNSYQKYNGTYTEEENRRNDDEVEIYPFNREAEAPPKPASVVVSPNPPANGSKILGAIDPNDVREYKSAVDVGVDPHEAVDEGKNAWRGTVYSTPPGKHRAPSPKPEVALNIKEVKPIEQKKPAPGEQAAKVEQPDLAETPKNRAVSKVSESSDYHPKPGKTYDGDYAIHMHPSHSHPSD